MHMVVCNKCGKTIDDDARFCSACGTEVGNSEPVKTGISKKNRISIKQISIAVLAFVVFYVLISNSGIACILAAIISAIAMIVSFVLFLVNKFQKKDNQIYILVCIASLAIFFVSIFTPTSMPSAVGSLPSNDTAEKIDETPVQETEISLSRVETEMLLNNVFEDTLSLMQKYSETIKYFSDNEFSTIEDIQSYEAMWGELFICANEIESNFTKYVPSEPYQECWETWHTHTARISELLSTCTNLDENGDGTYTGDEILKLIKESGNELVTRYEGIVEVVEQINIRILGTTTETEDEDYETVPICILADCNKEATYAMRSLDSIKILYSCEEHMSLNVKVLEVSGAWQLLDITPCVECGGVATHICKNPFSNKYEFYCQKHYDAIEEMMEALKESASSNTPEKNNSNAHTDSEAWVCAQSIVRNSLKNPRSAKFCPIADATITHLGNGKYQIEGWVEGTNGFGATIRENFVVTYVATARGYSDGIVVFP